MMINDEAFIEVEYSQLIKGGEAVAGDDFKTEIIPGEQRYISVLSDGLGSGIKAALLSNMTTAMALKFVAHNTEVVKSSEIIMDSLPVCEVRKISYATFTIVDLINGTKARVIEMDNHEFIHLRHNEEVKHEKKIRFSQKWPSRKLLLSEFPVQLEDRIIFFSDGVTQAGLGMKPHKFGWMRDGCLKYIQELIADNPEISARSLARSVVRQACCMDQSGKPLDDITCAVIYFRHPRRLRLLTGPPFKEENDSVYVDWFRNFNGKKIVCGGTTAQIVSRELGIPIRTDLKNRTRGLPPPSQMEGIDLVTEGILTLTELAVTLEKETPLSQMQPVIQNFYNLLMDSDVIEFIVGTKINEAHQDPNLPVDLEMRRNIIKRIQTCLENQYRKKVTVHYI